MKIFPAIDIKGGKCVRLVKGNFSNITKYTNSPLDQANTFVNFGFNNLHLIDLDGALKGDLVNSKIIKNIAQIKNLRIQVGGGVRSLEKISELLNIGVDTVILGTKAVEDLNFLEQACLKFKEKIAIAIDVRKTFIALSGWKEQTQVKAIDFLEKVKDFGISRIIYTDIDRDGTELGPNLEQSYSIIQKFNIPLIISGGIGSIQDVKRIVSDKKADGMIIGRAIYENKIKLEELSKFQ